LNGQQFTTANQQFQYYQQPSLGVIRPAFGVIRGGTPLTIRGAGFVSSSYGNFVRISFVSQSKTRYAIGHFVNSTQLVCSTPAATLGTGTVVLKV
ncbi:IPT/TIG domain-containing protein, partial [Escherichia coli]